MVIQQLFTSSALLLWCSALFICGCSKPDQSCHTLDRTNETGSGRPNETDDESGSLESLRQLLALSGDSEGLIVQIPQRVDLRDVDYLGVFIEDPVTEQQTRDMLTKVCDIVNEMHIRRLSLYVDTIDDYDLNVLRTMPHLQWLNVAEASSEGMKSIASLNDLQVLHLADTSVSASDLQELRDLTLNALSLSHCGIDDTSISGLVEMTSLRELNLSSTPISDRALEYLRGHLTVLDLSSTLITDHGLKELVRCHRLRQLFVSNTGITDEGLSVLVAACSELRVLFARNCRVTGKAFRRGNLSSLKWLDLSFTDISDADVANLTRATRLEVLNLAGTSLSDSGAKRLAGLTNLKSLSVGGTQVSDDGLAWLQAALPNCNISNADSPEESNPKAIW